MSAFIGLTSGGMTHDQMQACLAAGGSGTGCAVGTFWGKALLAIAFLGAGLGARFWSRR